MTLMKRYAFGREWDPFQEMEKLQRELNRVFDVSLSDWNREPSGLLEGDWYPAVDVTDHKDSIRVRTDLPGIKKEDIEVSFQEGSLIIKGERKNETRKEDAGVLRDERVYGSFTRTLRLPSPVDAASIKAVYRDGVLELTLPKTEEAKPRKIDVQVS